MTTTLPEFAAKCQRAAAAVEPARRAGARKAAAGLTARVRSDTAAAAGGDSRLSGVGRTGRRVSARYDVLASGDVVIKATGPYQLLERDTKAHVEPRQRRRGRRRILHIPGVGWRASARHPGTRGKHTFQNAVQDYAPKVPRVVHGEVHDAMVKAFT